MAYTVRSTERLRKPGADMETKALLYLMNLYKDSKEIHYFIVDFFNDITGMDRASTKLWDMQSKGASNSSPKAVGKDLVTLYKNFLSNFAFCSYILFSGGVSKSFRIDDTKNIFGIENVKPSAVKKLVEGLIKESQTKTYIDNSKITKQSIDDFLKNIIFVVDDNKPSDYVKAIIKDHPHIIPEESVLNAIFNEIRNEQSNKKNGQVVEGIEIATCDEALNYYRHLTNNEIMLLTLQRIINRDPISRGIPQPFSSIYNQCPPENQKDMLDECQSALCRALFNKNSAQSFWEIFEKIYQLILEYPDDNVQELFRKLDPSLINNCPDFDAQSVKYFIAVIKEGIQQ